MKGETHKIKGEITTDKSGISVLTFRVLSQCPACRSSRVYPRKDGSKRCNNCGVEIPAPVTGILDLPGAAGDQ